MIANAVEWALTDRPGRTYPELLRYETNRFFNGKSYQGANA